MPGYLYLVMLLALIEIYRFFRLIAYLRVFAYLQRLEHIRAWNGVFNDQTIGYANEYAREYPFKKLFTLKRAYKKHVKEIYGSNPHTFVIQAKILGYSRR